MLSWDIRSVSQRSRPLVKIEGGRNDDDASNEEGGENDGETCIRSSIVYHLVLEGIDVSYRIDSDANVWVEKVSAPSP